MKKMLFMFFIPIYVSCSNTDLNTQLEKAISKEIGKAPFKNEPTVFNDKTYVIIWDSVSLDLKSHSTIKNTVDKTFGVLPYKHKESSYESSSNEYWKYENTLYHIELNYYYKDSAPGLMMVRLLITSK